MRLPWHVIGRNNHSASSGSAMSAVCPRRASPSRGHHGHRRRREPQEDRSPPPRQGAGRRGAHRRTHGGRRGVRVLLDRHRRRRGPLCLHSDISLVCVGTPSGAGGGLSTTYLETVTRRDRRGTGGQGRLARCRLPQHHGARHLREPADPAAGTGVRQACRGRLRGLRESRVPARGDERSRLLRSPQDRCRPERPRQRRHGDGTVRRAFPARASGCLSASRR